MKFAVTTAAFLALMTMTSTASLARCGPFNVFQADDYCVACAKKTFKLNYCPGGEAGRVTVGRQHADCTVSFYDAATCHMRGARRHR